MGTRCRLASWIVLPLALALVAASGLAGVAGAAPGDRFDLRTTQGLYDGPIALEPTTQFVELQTSLGLFACADAALGGVVAEAGSPHPALAIESVSFAPERERCATSLPFGVECDLAPARTPWRAVVRGDGGKDIGEAELVARVVGVEMGCGPVRCGWGGRLEGKVTFAGPPIAIAIPNPYQDGSASLPRTAGGLLCPARAALAGDFDLTGPRSLRVGDVR